MMAVPLRKIPVAGQFQPGTSACSLPGSRPADQMPDGVRYGRRPKFVAIHIGLNRGKRGQLHYSSGLADSGLRK
jgi:hypothetical protein